MTSLTVNGSAKAATTLAAAGQLFSATGGSSGNTSTKVGSGTQFKQIFAKGTTTNQTGVASIPAPTDSNFNGWMWDVTTLEGNNLLAGTWTPTIHLLASTGTTITPTVAWYKRSSAGSYTSIGSVAGSSIALTTSSQALTFTPPSLSAMAFATGDKLVMWLWVNQTAGGATNSTISVVEATSASSAGVTSEAQAVTPGYLPTTVTKSTGVRTPVRTQGPSTKVYAATVLADSPVAYYRLGETSGLTAFDSTANAYNGTISATGVTLSQAGALAGDADTSMLFDGTNGLITLPAGLKTDGWAALSIECWVYLTNNTSNFAHVISNNTNAGANHIGFCLALDIVADGVAGFFEVGTGTTGVDLSWGNAALSTNTWYHLVGTYDGANLRIYQNGTLVAGPSALTGTIGTALTALFIGTNSGGIIGRIDEVAIYSTALSASRITAHYTQGTAPAKALGYPVRIPVRTQVTKTITGVRTPVRTTITKSLGLRLLSRTQKTVSSALRVLSRTQKTVSTSLRAVIKGITKVAPLRVPVKSLVSKSLPLRARVRSQVSDVTVLRVMARTVHSLSSPLRAVIASLISKTAPLRVRVRTQVTDSAVLRLVARTTHSRSSPLRSVVASLMTKSVPLRTRVSTTHTLLVSVLTVVTTKMTQSTPVRVILRGRALLVGIRARLRTVQSLTTALRTVVTAGVNLATKSSVLRVSIRTARSLSHLLRVRVSTGVSALVGIRARIASRITESTVVRVVAATKHNLSAQVRISVHSLVSKTSILRVRVASRVTNSIRLRVVATTKQSLVVQLRAPVRSLVSKASVVRMRVASTVTTPMPLRTVVRGLTKVMGLRVPLRTQRAASLILRIVAMNAIIVKSLAVRLSVRTAVTPTATLRIVCIQPNAVVLVRSGAGEFRVRGGQATVLVRSGEAELLVRSGKATIVVEEDS